MRERKSLELLRSISITNSMYVPDALWSHDFDNDIYVKCPEILKDFDFGKPYICLGDSSGIHNNFSDAKWNVADIYTRLIKEIKSKTEYDIVFVDGYNGGNDEINKIIRRNELRSVALWNCSYHELYYVLKQSRAFISGRWHASIISLLANTPIILWGLCGWKENGRLITTADQAGTAAIRPAFEAMGYTFKYIYSVVGKPLPLEKIRAFISASCARSKLRSARVGTMGYRDMLLYGTQYEGNSMRGQIGVEVEPFEMLEMMQNVEKLDQQEVAAGVAFIKENWKLEKYYRNGFCDGMLLIGGCFKFIIS